MDFQHQLYMYDWTTMSTYIVLCITIANNIIIRQNILIINSLLMLAMPVHTATLHFMCCT